jgi:hypothetical protein
VKLFKKNKLFKWTTRWQKSFNKIKKLFKKKDIRQHFKFNKLSFINANVLNCAIKARL